MFDILLQFLIASQLQQLKVAALDFFTPQPQEQLVIERVHGDIIDIAITAASAIAVDKETGVIVYAKEADEVRPIASITKLMTALVFLDQGVDMNALVTLREVDRHEGGMIHFNIGEKIRVADLLYATLVASDNDSAYALMRTTGLGQETFVTKMNEKARALGMEHAVFVEPTGLDHRNVATAHDLVHLLDAAAAHSLIADAATRSTYVAEVVGLDDKPREVRMYTTDQLTRNQYIRLLVGKTGYLPQAGYCLATKLKGQNDREYYIIALGSATITDRFQDVKAIEYYITNTYQWN